MSPVLSLIAIATMTAPPVAQEQANFTRTCKVGDQAVYAYTQTIESFKTTFLCNLTVSVVSLQAEGRPALKFHMSNMDTKVPPNTTSTFKQAADETHKLGPKGFPVSFTPEMGGTDFVYLLHMLVSTTFEKEAKVGDTMPFNWSGGPAGQTLGFDGTLKVTEISAANKRLKAEINAKILSNGTSVGTFTNVSTYSLPDCSLLESIGDFHVMTKQEIVFKRKA